MIVESPLIQELFYDCRFANNGPQMRGGEV